MPSNPAPLIHSGAKSARLIRAAWVLLVFAILFRASLCQATDRFVSLTGAHQSPFANWADAATNIQSAIDVAADGDVIWVTNGIYNNGGKVMAGDLTNRVALDKAITVQSASGPAVTIIEGQRDYVSADATNAVRCAWLTNGAVLSGFTLRAGQTRSTGDAETLRNGGGVWCVSTSATVTNCIVRDNLASNAGGGAYRGTLINCFVSGNEASSGGGASTATLLSCAILENNASGNGGGCISGSLTNCTLTRNFASTSGGGLVAGTAYNCVVWENQSPSGSNYGGATFSFSCTLPLPGGTGNLGVNPLLLADGLHIASNSPVRTAGSSAVVSGIDFDGQSWGSPPSMGCDQWHSTPAVTQPKLTPDRWGRIRLSTVAAGQEPLAYSWLLNGIFVTADVRHDGVSTNSLQISGFGPQDAGSYAVVVSNAFGSSTSLVAQVVVHCVDAAAASPLAPFSNWSTAAGTIQDAIDTAHDGDVLLVTNGVYATGGRVMSGDLTNRVAFDKPLIAISCNGPVATIITGQKDPATNGPAAIRSAWLTKGTYLSGFTLRDGATRSSGDQVQLCSGGGVWARTTNALVADCNIVDNAAIYGGGAFRAGVVSSTVMGNLARTEGGGVQSNLVRNTMLVGNAAGTSGGGASGATLVNCALTENVANTGGGAYKSVLRNATVASNRARFSSAGGGTHTSTHTNCTVWNNLSGGILGNYALAVAFRASCTTPLPSGVGNIALDPLLLPDNIHIASNSPCRAAGLTIATATDIDGQAWNSPPAIGCDEWQPEPLVASPAMRFETWGQAQMVSFAVGQSPFTFRWLKDGVELSDSDSVLGTTTTNLELRSLAPADAGQYQLIVSNAFGSATSSVARLTIRCVDVNSQSPAPPYQSWATAANRIQDAVDVSSAGDVILVTNGIYAQGGRAIATGLTNRVALDKPLFLMSICGPTATIIQGAWDVTSINGPGAVRCAWLADGAAILGFTLRGGATLSGGDIVGGGVRCNSTNAWVVSCILRGCTAAAVGAGAYQGTLINSLVTANQCSGQGTGTAYSSLINCTVTGNSPSAGPAAGYYGEQTNLVRNSIIWGNQIPAGDPEASGATFSYTCTRPLKTGVGNISADPRLSPDGMRLGAGSPCANAGTALLAFGADIDRQAWATPPSMGCDEAHSEIAVDWPALVASGDGKIRLGVSPVGAAPQSFTWFKDGSLVTNDARISGAQSAELSITDFGPADVGGYFSIVTNSLGSVTGAVVQVRARFVDAANPTPAPPYTNWTTAATNIQDAVDAAAVGDLVLVADGVYASDGRIVVDDLANRVVIGKALTVSSRFGSTGAIIEGQKDFSGTNGNGNAAIRAVWLDNWTSLGGFTIRNGATRTNGSAVALQSGGGILALGPNATARGCVISSNSAALYGGGAYAVNLVDSGVAGNVAANGGGIARASADRSVLKENTASVWAGGAYQSSIHNSLVLRNSGKFSGGTYESSVINSVIAENQGVGLGFASYAYNSIVWGNSPSNYGTSLYFSHTCTTPPIFPSSLSTNNITADPQLLDNFHLAPTSPCRGAGGTAFFSGTDFDGDPWSNPPSIGAQEFVDGGQTGPLAVSLEAASTNALVNRSLTFAGRITGRASRLEWSFGDGTVITNIGYLGTHAWVAPGSYPVTLTVFNDDHPDGVATNLAVQIALPDAPVLTGEKLDNTIYRVWFFGQAGASNAVQFATNLNAPVFWHTFQNNVSTGSVMQVFDVTASNAMRFYRVRAQ